jgi:hypothetical protein
MGVYGALEAHATPCNFWEIYDTQHVIGWGTRRGSGGLEAHDTHSNFCEIYDTQHVIDWGTRRGSWGLGSYQATPLDGQK